MNIKGIIPALITPFNADESINYESLKAQIERLIGLGVGGFYACGSTAECFLLTDDERKKVLETITKTVNGRVPVIAHIGNIGTQKSIDLAKHAESCGVTAVSSVPPFYYKFSFDEIAHYYEAISKAVDLPMIIYNFPAFSGVTINADNIGTLLDSCHAEGLKYTAMDLFELEKISRRYPDLKLYNGHDEVFCNALPVGIDGAVGSTFNLMPQKYMQIQKDFEAGNVKAAAAGQNKVNEIIEALIKTGVQPGIKYLLTKYGFPCGECRAPFAPVSKESKALLDSIYDKVFD